MRDPYAEAERWRAWAAAGLDRGSLTGLLHHVEERVAEEGCDHTLRFAEEWAAEHGHDWRRLCEALGDAGGYCDCEVLLNADPDADA